MNTLAWNITIDWNKVVPKNFDYDFVESLSKTWDKNLFIFWETWIKTSKELIESIEKTFWKLKDYDISISTEDKIKLLPYDFDEWFYELASFEWEEVDYEEITDRFAEHDAIFSIREAWISPKFWNKIIKADFVY